MLSQYVWICICCCGSYFLYVSWWWWCFKEREYYNQIFLWGKNDPRALTEKHMIVAKLQERENTLSQGSSLGSEVG